MDDKGAADGTDYGWLAKVLAGDPLACALLDLARNLSEPGLDSFERRVQQVRKAGSGPGGGVMSRQEKRRKLHT